MGHGGGGQACCALLGGDLRGAWRVVWSDAVAGLVLRDNEATHALNFFVLNVGQPSGWPAKSLPARAAAAVTRRAEARAEDPRSGLTAAGDPAPQTRAERSKSLPARPIYPQRDESAARRSPTRYAAHSSISRRRSNRSDRA